MNMGRIGSNTDCVGPNRTESKKFHSFRPLIYTL